MNSIPILPNPSSIDPKLLWSPNHDNEFIVVTDTVFLYRINTKDPRAIPTQTSSEAPASWKDFVAELAIAYPTLQKDVITTDLAQLKASITGASHTSQSTYFQLLDAVKVSSPAPNGIWVRHEESAASNRSVTSNDVPPPSTLAKMDVHTISSISWRPVNALLDATLRTGNSFPNIHTKFSSSSPYIISIAYAEGWVWTVQLRPTPSAHAIPADIDDLEAYTPTNSAAALPSSDYDRFLAELTSGPLRAAPSTAPPSADTLAPHWPSRVAVVPPELSVRALAHNPTLPCLLAVGRGPRARMPLLAVYDTSAQEAFLSDTDSTTASPHASYISADARRSDRVRAGPWSDVIDVCAAGETVLVPDVQGAVAGAPPLMASSWRDASGQRQQLASCV